MNCQINTMDKDSKTLTRAEEEVMQILWEKEKAFVKEIVEEFPEPKPAYNTISTIIRILEKKGMVAYEAFGRTHQYYPLLTKEEYAKQTATNLVSGYFNGSYEKLLSFFVKEKNISAKELENIIKNIDKS